LRRGLKVRHSVSCSNAQFGCFCFVLLGFHTSVSALVYPLHLIPLFKHSSSFIRSGPVVTYDTWDTVFQHFIPDELIFKSAVCGAMLWCYGQYQYSRMDILFYCLIDNFTFHVWFTNIKTFTLHVLGVLHAVGYRGMHTGHIIVGSLICLCISVLLC
jgi:hypothetical protein